MISSLARAIARGPPGVWFESSRAPLRGSEGTTSGHRRPSEPSGKPPEEHLREAGRAGSARRRSEAFLG
eukprot:14764602-Alexandrium_andersonii.AAC.1